jgi:hypothetical protein
MDVCCVSRLVFLDYEIKRLPPVERPAGVLSPSIHTRVVMDLRPIYEGEDVSVQ